MKVISCQLENFSSYEKLDFNFVGQNLCLIQGPTGAGKSTLCDVIPWILFGKTAKGGAVDEVLSWPGGKITNGLLMIETAGVQWYICRIRGSKSKDNDLYYIANCTDERAIRGRDLVDTQKLINQRLGMDYETYLAGAYYHEFSQTAQFFNTTAKNRRQITEQLVDLSLATDLLVKSQEANRHVNKALAAYSLNLRDISLQLDYLQASKKIAQSRYHKWRTENENKHAELQAKFDKFEADRQHDLNEHRRAIQTWKSLIEPLPNIDLNPKCPTCGQNTDSPELHQHGVKQAANEKAAQKIDYHSEKIKETKLKVNPFNADVVVSTTNPYTIEIAELAGKSHIFETEQIKIQALVTISTQESEDHELLQEVIADYRSTTIKNSIQGLQDNTNKLLSDHFDAEIRVEFQVEDADKLEVNITMDGNSCVFSQLSKGQRCLLKLCFGVSVMQAVANHNGLSFAQVFFDEALSGLDENLKLKSFRLLETLAYSHESVFVVEHSSEMRVLFENSFTVAIENGKSVINAG